MMETREGYKKTKIGWIPEDWDIKNLEAITLLLKDGTHGTHENVQNGIPLLSAKDICNGKIKISSDSRLISKADFLNIHKKYAIKLNDILLTIVGTLGRVAIVSDYSKEFTVQRSVAIIRFNKNLSHLFFYFLMQSSYFQQILITRSNASAQAGVYLGELKKIKIILPPLPEQQKIAAILSTVDKKIESIEEQIKQTEQLKKGLMNKLLTEGIGHTEFKDTQIGRIPKNWDFGKLTDIAEIVMGQSPPGDSYNDFGAGMPMLNGPTEFTKKSPVPLQYTTKITKTCKKNDILFCVRGSSTGRMNIADQEYCIGRGLGAIRQKEKSITQFIYFILVNIADKVLQEAKGAGSTFPNVNSKELSGKLIAIPPEKEQKKIATILGSVDEKIDVLHDKKATYEILKKGLMAQLLTGQMRVKL